MSARQHIMRRRMTTCTPACPGVWAGPMACNLCESDAKISIAYSGKENQEMEGGKMGSEQIIRQALIFTMPIVPTAQARPRVAVRGKFAQAYKTKDQQSNERTLEACLLTHRPRLPLSGPLTLSFAAAMPVPKSASKKTIAAMLDGSILPVKKPDLDNLAKQLKDAMTRMQFWHDDCQIVRLYCNKIYAESGFWRVAVFPAVEFKQE